MREIGILFFPAQTGLYIPRLWPPDTTLRLPWQELSIIFYGFPWYSTIFRCLPLIFMYFFHYFLFQNMPAYYSTHLKSKLSILLATLSISANRGCFHWHIQMYIIFISTSNILPFKLTYIGSQKQLPKRIIILLLIRCMII